MTNLALDHEIKHLCFAPVIDRSFLSRDRVTMEPTVSPGQQEKQVYR